MALRPQGRVGDAAKIEKDSHSKSCCPHTCEGPATSGSPNVTVNNKAALRVKDPGVHKKKKCCGANEWKAKKGSSTVTINGKPAHRIDDETEHCGGKGKLIEGSPNLSIGG